MTKNQTARLRELLDRDEKRTNAALRFRGKGLLRGCFRVPRQSAREAPKEQFRREVEKELTGRETDGQHPVGNATHLVVGLGYVTRGIAHHRA